MTIDIHNHALQDSNIQELDPMVLLEITSTFGALVNSNPQLVALCNNLGPILFATLLVIAAQEFVISADGEGVEPSKDIFEAEGAAIGYIRSVTAAFGKLDGSITVEPTDSEVDQDTEINPV